MRWRALLLLVVATTGAAVEPVAAGSREAPEGLAELRELYYRAVDRAAALPLAEREVASRLARAPAGSEQAAILEGYRGALLTLRAKHGHWPPGRLKHLGEGFAVLDAVVAEHPSLAEVRYLRLMSGYYLPAVLGRRAHVREDFRALAAILPLARSELPADLYRAVAHFVLENGGLAAEETRALRLSLPPG
jgi:hypothetical protein